MSLITNNAKNDRNELHAIPIEKRVRTALRLETTGDVPPFRALYLSGNRDIVIFKTIINFFNAVQKLFWNDLSKDSSGVIRKTAGIQAWFYVLKKTLPKALESMNLRQEIWESLLQKAQRLNWDDPILAESSAKGKGRIQDAILVMIGQKDVSTVKDSTLQNYLRSTLQGFHDA